MRFGGSQRPTGGAGVDRFVIGSVAAAGDTITDFTSGTDYLYLGSGAFGTYTSGQTVSLSQGTGSSDAIFGAQTTQGFAYNTSTGALYFDSDGSGSATSILVATLSGAPPLAASDIHIS